MQRARGLVLLVVLVEAAACSTVPETCTTRWACGEGYACDFDATSRCNTVGRCASLSALRARGICPESIAGATQICGCDGRSYTTMAECHDVPARVVGLTCEASCMYVDRAQPLDPDRCLSAPAGLYDLPSACCDCARAVAGADRCRAEDGQSLPDGCCVCVTPGAPDPSGDCAIPGGELPAGASQWCCPRRRADGGAS